VFVVLRVCFVLGNTWAEAFIKGLVHPKMKIMSLMTHPHVVPSP